MVHVVSVDGHLRMGMQMVYESIRVQVGMLSSCCTVLIAERTTDRTLLGYLDVDILCECRNLLVILTLPDLGSVWSDSGYAVSV